MEVNLDLKPIQWSAYQGCLYCGEDWILLYSINEVSGKWEAIFELTCCQNLTKKHNLTEKQDPYTEAYFESRGEAVKACESHYRELMLKAFLQPV